MAMYRRFAAAKLAEAVTDTPVVLVIGPRRAGKTTLVRSLEGERRPYLTLDDSNVLEAARSDPAGFVRGLDGAILDEIQRAPELLLAIKKAVDEDLRPGRFVLTGSANVLTLPRVADSLAGRMETIRLLPLAQAEIAGTAPRFVDDLFAGTWAGGGQTVLGEDLVRTVLAGGFPEMLVRATERRRRDWGQAYLDSVLTRDLQDIAAVERLTDLPRFVRFVAEHVGQPVNYSAFGASIDVTHKTATRYLGLLEQVFLLKTVEPWFSNRVKRLTKTPKLHFVDSGLLAVLRGMDFDRAVADKTAFGHVLESFVFSEVLKLAGASDARVSAYHFRDENMHEVDIVLERADGAVAGIEIKAAASVKAADFAGMRKLAEACGARFAFGAVLYDGSAAVPFGDRLAAVPLSRLWA